MSTTTLVPITEVGTCCAPLTRETLTAGQASGLARSLKALADPTRLRLISIVAGYENQEACACDLAEPVGLSQSTVSHHLKVLTDAGFLNRRQVGTWAHFALVPGVLDSVARLLTSACSRAHDPEQMTPSR